MAPSCYYHIALDPTGKQRTRSFNISHVIGSDDFERFFIVLGSETSAMYMLRFKFYINNGQTIESQLFNVHIWNPKNSIYHRNRFDEQQNPFSNGPSTSATRLR